MVDDILNLEDANIPLIERVDNFNKAIESYGGDNYHILSYEFKVKPQIILTYFELNTLNEEELTYLNGIKLDLPILNVLMLIGPELRRSVYKHIDEFLNDKYPITRIFRFIDEELEISILELYTSINPRFWGEVSKYLKSKGIDDGTINKSFRGMLIGLAKRKSSKKRLEWLERAIIHDHMEQLRVFTSKSLTEKYPDDVERIREFIKSINP